MNKIRKDFICENSPCYIYSKGEIIKHCMELQKSIPYVQFLYSIKTNPFSPVLSTITSCGFGADAASAQEVMLANDAGLNAGQIFYSSPGKTKKDIIQAFGKCTFIADSFHELELLSSYAEQKGEVIKVGIRINPNYGMATNYASASKFGIDEVQLGKLPQFMKKIKNVIITGIHVHIQSQVLDASILSHYYENCYLLAERVAGILENHIEFINFGSGIGAVYDRKKDHPVELSILSKTISRLEKKNSHGLRAKFYIETGRFVTCNAGTYYTRIIDKKVSQGHTFLIVENSMNGFLRPSIAALLKNTVGNNQLSEKNAEPLYTSKNEFDVQILNDEDKKEIVSIVGNLCTALDVIVEDTELPVAQIGDIVTISNAGSYGYTLSPLLFSSHAPPSQFLGD